MERVRIDYVDTDAAVADGLRLELRANGYDADSHEVREQAGFPIGIDFDLVLTRPGIVVPLLSHRSIASRSMRAGIFVAQSIEDVAIVPVLLEDLVPPDDLLVLRMIDARDISFSTAVDQLVSTIEAPRRRASLPRWVDLHRAPVIDEGPSAFIGRKRELAVLSKEIWLRERVVYVTGPAGIGKTSLIREFLLRGYLASQWHQSRHPQRRPRPGHVQVVDGAEKGSFDTIEAWFEESGRPPTIVATQDVPGAGQFKLEVAGLTAGDLLEALPSPVYGSPRDAGAILEISGTAPNRVRQVVDLVRGHDRRLQELLEDLRAYQRLLAEPTDDPALESTGWYYVSDSDPFQLRQIETSFAEAHELVGFHIDLMEHAYGSFRRWWRRRYEGRADEVVNKVERAADLAGRVTTEARSLNDAAQGILSLAEAHGDDDESIIVWDNVISLRYIDPISGRKHRITEALTPTQLREFEALRNTCSLHEALYVVLGLAPKEPPDGSENPVLFGGGWKGLYGSDIRGEEPLSGPLPTGPED